MKAIDQLKEEFISLEELADYMQISRKRILDMVSLHKTDGKFMTAYKASAGTYFFLKEDVRTYILSRATTSETEEEKE